MYKIKKALISLMLICILLINSNLVYADDIGDIEELDIINVSADLDLAKEPEINSRAAIIYDRNSKEIIWGKKEHEKRKMASTTKIMTAIVVLENCSLSDVVTVSKKAAAVGGSRLGLKTNDKISIRDLLYGLLLVSGNDAAIALAEHTAGSVEEFANFMNNKAKVLQLENTNFVTPHGLDSEEHYTTAYELAIMADYALKNDTFAKMVNTKNYTVTINGNSKNLSNTNELLGNLSGVNGVKTGFTNGANRCLVTSINRNGMNIITVVLGADTKKFRTSDSIKLVEYAYSNYKNMKITDIINKKYMEWKDEFEKNIIVSKGVQKNIQTRLGDIQKEYITIKNNKENDIYIQIDSVFSLEAPVEEQIIVGTINLFIGNELKVSVDIINEENIRKMNIKDYYKKLVTNNFKIMCEV